MSNIDECHECGKSIDLDNDEYEEIASFYVCAECAEDIRARVYSDDNESLDSKYDGECDGCSECHKAIVSEEDKVAYEIAEMCRDCLHENSDFVCSECGESFSNEEHEQGSGLCPECRADLNCEDFYV
jgi:DNA-directed RNA polymerase subunit RPC12/RpoP